MLTCPNLLQTSMPLDLKFRNFCRAFQRFPIQHSKPYFLLNHMKQPIDIVFITYWNIEWKLHTHKGATLSLEKVLALILSILTWSYLSTTMILSFLRGPNSDVSKVTMFIHMSYFLTCFPETIGQEVMTSDLQNITEFSESSISSR